MRSLKLTLSYDGTDFCGWQAQAAGRTIQQVVEAAWQAVTSEQIRVTASGRTDAGVHAVGQIVSLQTETELPVEVVARALNANLPADVRIISVAETATGFHAIRDATAKRYRYVIQDCRIPNLFFHRYAWHIFKPLDLAAMQQAAQLLVGQHDFASFQAAGSPRTSTIRNVTELVVERRRGVFSDGDQTDLLCIEIEADGFLYNMVRNIVGTLVQVGRDVHDADWVQQVLKALDRTTAGPTAPAHGLCLLSVTYDD